MPIHQLNPDVINQIAAGEVIERPANLLKELIENSLDAGATQIAVEADDGGRTLVVRDNGSGFHRQDLDVVLSRHATSKIQKADDLWSLASYGFRGEALSSISAVSDFELTTRNRAEDTGYRLAARFGERFGVDSLSHAPGTQIRVAKLFENVPARLKFLRSGSAEFAQIRKTLKAFALSHPSIELSYMEKRKLECVWPKTTSLKERAEQVLGLKPFFEVDSSSDDVSVQVAFGSPSLVQGNSQNLWIFVQGRWIQDRSLQQAVLESYRGLLMHGEFPIAVVQVTVPPEAVDINVHPAKSQVRFQDPSKIFRRVHHTLRAALESTPWAPRETPLSQPVSPDFVSDNALETPVLRSARPAELQTRFSEDFDFARTQLKTKNFPAREPAPRAAEARMSTPSPTVRLSTFWQNLHIIGQAQQTYILAQSATTLFTIDQHAAHERVLFERLMAQRKTQSLALQPLLVPVEVTLSAPEAEYVWEHRQDVESLGMKLDRRSETTLLIEEGAPDISEKSFVLAIRGLANELATETKTFSFEDAVQNAFALMACHSAIRAGQAMSPSEIRSLLSQMDEFPLSGYCPHGRPSYLEKTFVEIETQFGRRG